MVNSERCKKWVAIATGISAGSASLSAIEPADILVYSKEPFLLRPRLALTEVYNDNVFSRPDAKEDFITTVSPGLNMRLGKEVGNFISFDYTFNQHFYAKLDDLDAGEHSFLIRNKLQGQRLVLMGTDRIELLANPIGVTREVSLGGPRDIPGPVREVREGETPSPAPAIDPGSPVRGGEVVTSFLEENVEYDSQYHSYNLGYSISEKTAAYVQGQYASTDYEKGIGLYDLNTWRATGGFAFQALPKTSFFGEVYYGQTSTDPNFTAPDNPSVDFIGGFLGARGNFTEKLSGVVKVGYESREFSDDSDAPSSPVVDLSLNHRLSEKTEISLAYSRLHDVSVQYSAESYTANVVSAQINQAFGSAGKWRASLGGSYGMYEYESATVATDREYDRYAAYFNLDYRIQQWLSARLGYIFDTIKYSLAGADYDVNRVTLGVAIGY